MHPESRFHGLAASLILSCALFASNVPAQAADATAPVREIMDEAVKNWSPDPGEGRDYFDADRLKRIFSKDFAAVYEKAAKFPAYDDGASPFGYDVIVNGEESCALEDVAILPGPETGGQTDVKVTFDNTRCLGERLPDWKPVELHFLVLAEQGHPVIDDILRSNGEGSVKEELAIIARSGDADSN